MGAPASSPRSWLHVRHFAESLPATRSRRGDSAVPPSHRRVQQHLGGRRVRRVTHGLTGGPAACRTPCRHGQSARGPQASSISEVRSTGAPGGRLGQPRSPGAGLWPFNTRILARHQGHRLPARSSAAARSGCSAARRQQDRRHPGDDRGSREFGGYSVFCGVGERTREGNDLWRGCRRPSTPTRTARRPTSSTRWRWSSGDERPPARVFASPSPG